MLSQQLKAYMSELRTDLKASKEQLNIYKQIRKGTLVYAEHLQIYVARSGVGEWILACHGKDWVSIYKGRRQDPENFAKETYKRTSIYEKNIDACTSVRLFYQEDKPLLNTWAFITPDINGLRLPERSN